MRDKFIPPVSLQVSQSRYCHLEKTIQRSRAGLHLACEGPPDWPESTGSFESRGQSMQGYLRLANIDPDLAISLGTMAIQGIKSSVTVAQLKESADFFGVTNLYTFAPGLPGATKDPPSGDAT